MLENQDTRPEPPGRVATNAGRVGNETASTSRLKGNLALPISAQGRWRASLKSQKTQASKERLANDKTDSVFSGPQLLRRLATRCPPRHALSRRVLSAPCARYRCASWVQKRHYVANHRRYPRRVFQAGNKQLDIPQLFRL